MAALPTRRTALYRIRNAGDRLLMEVRMSTDPLEPLIPPHPEVVAYQAEVDAALRGNPERAARLAALEAECGRAETAEAFRAGSMKIVALLDEVHDEVDAARRAARKPVPWRGGQPWPSSFGQSSTPAHPGQISESLGATREADGHRSGSPDALTSE